MLYQITGKQEYQWYAERQFQYIEWEWEKTPQKKPDGIGLQVFLGIFEMKKDIIYEISDTCGSL